MSIPPSVGKCKKLRHLDLRETLISTLPDEVSALPRLVQLELPLDRMDSTTRAAAAQGGPSAVMGLLHSHQEHASLAAQLRQELRLKVYPEAADTPQGAEGIDALTHAVASALPQPRDLRTLIRNAARLFPASLEEASLPAVQAALRTLQRDNTRKQLSTQLESKLRAVYFDRVEPPQVEAMVRSVLAGVPRLADVRFVLQHAAALFPEQPQDVSGAAIQASVETLRESLRAKRAAAVTALQQALAAHFPGEVPSDLAGLAQQLAKGLPSAADVRALASDVPELLPTDFLNVKPARVLRRFRAAQVSQAGGAPLHVHSTASSAVGGSTARM